MILYIHGFLSTGKGAKPSWFAKQCELHKVPFLAPTYAQKSPVESILFFEEIIEQSLRSETKSAKTCLIVGSSLGGYFAYCLAQKFNLPFILINPVSPKLTLFQQYEGWHTNEATGEKLQVNERFNEELLSLADNLAYTKVVNKNGLVLLDKGDEVLPYHVAEQFFKDLAQVQTYEEGCHAFLHLNEAWPLINEKFSSCFDSNE